MDDGAMIRPLYDSVSLADFYERADEHLQRLRETAEAQALTINGRPAAIIQDPAAYARLHQELDRLSTQEAIREGLASVQRGEGRPMREFLHGLAATHGIKLDQ